MTLVLNEIEIRILGCLMEKEVTTPEYYPLSLNALTNACNQKSSRDPVMDLSESDISRTLESLKDKHLVWQLSTTGSRVPKYEHNMRSTYQIDQSESALLCVLMLRGFQTAGELRSRTERLHSFSSIDTVVEVLNGLAHREGLPLVKELPRQPGRKESRFAHLLSGEPEISESSESGIIENEPVSQVKQYDPDKLGLIESELTSLKDELALLKIEFERFRKQFE